MSQPPTPTIPSPLDNVQTGQNDEPEPDQAEEKTDVKEAPSRKPYFEVVRDTDGEWHWCLWSGNGRAMATNPKGYPRMHDCKMAVKTMCGLMKTATPPILVGE